MVADIEVDIVADIEVDMVPAWRWTRWPTWWPKKKKEKRRKVVDMELDMVADIKVDKVADMEVDIDINININKKIRFGERVGHEGWLIESKLFRPEAYPACISSKLCEFIICICISSFVSQPGTPKKNQH